MISIKEPDFSYYVKFSIIFTVGRCSNDFKRQPSLQLRAKVLQAEPWHELAEQKLSVFQKQEED